jgi:hypothetical protein
MLIYQQCSRVGDDLSTFLQLRREVGCGVSWKENG